MKSFREFISEKVAGSLFIFDIDETIFHTYSTVLVKDQHGKVVAALDNQQFNDYKLKPGEEFDFSDFKNAQKFFETSKPIKRMIAKILGIMKRMSPQSKMVIVTARADFDNKDLFLATFKKHGIRNIQAIHVHRAGNLGPGAPDQNKKVVIKKLLDTGNYAKARLFDDSRSNLKMFNSLKADYPHITFQSFLAFPDGSVKTFKEI